MRILLCDKCEPVVRKEVGNLVDTYDKPDDYEFECDLCRDPFNEEDTWRVHIYESDYKLTSKKVLLDKVRGES